MRQTITRPKAKRAPQDHPPVMSKQFVISLGAPSRGVEWAERVLFEVLHAYDVAEHIYLADSVEAFGRALLVNPGAGGVVVARAPLDSLAKIIQERSVPTVIFHAPPSDCVRDLMTEHGLDFRLATIFATNCFNAIATISRECGDKCELFHVERSTTLHAIVHFISQCFSLSVDTTLEFIKDRSEQIDFLEKRFKEFSKGINGNYLIQSPKAGMDRFPLSVEDEAMISGASKYAIRILSEPPPGAEIGSMFWARSLFVFPEQGDENPKRFDLTGASRCLFYGPYIRLPEGSWQISCRFRADSNSIGVKILMDVVNGVNITRYNFEIEFEGLFDYEFLLPVSQPDHPIEIRVFTAIAAFEGNLSFEGITLTEIVVPKILATDGARRSATAG